jgi:hypothetical protein
MADQNRSTLPPGGSSMPPSNPTKKVQVGLQYRPELGGKTTAPTQPPAQSPAPSLPKTAK